MDGAKYSTASDSHLLHVKIGYLGTGSLIRLTTRFKEPEPDFLTFSLQENYYGVIFCPNLDVLYTVSTPP